MGRSETATASLGIKILLSDLVSQIDETNFDLIKKILEDGFIEDDKKAVDEYKKAHSAEWLQVLGTKDFDIVEENEMQEDIRDIFDNEPTELETNEQ
jgi:hypothetical protein